MKGKVKEPADHPTGTQPFKAIIVIDECSYSRMAIEFILVRFCSVVNILSFECVTDYKVWNDGRLGEDSFYIIINTSSTSLYCEDVHDLLMYENKSGGGVGLTRIILLLSSSRQKKHYSRVILSNYLLHSYDHSKISIIKNVSGLEISRVTAILKDFVNVGDGGVVRFNSSRESDEKLTWAEERALKILLSGRSIQSSSVYYGVSTKTLYAQRSSAISKLM